MSESKTVPEKINEYWEAANKYDKIELIYTFRILMKLTIKEIAFLLNMTEGQARYAAWKYRYEA